MCIGGQPPRTDSRMPRRQPARETSTGPTQERGRRTLRVLVVSPVRAPRGGPPARLVLLGIHPAITCDAPTAAALLHQCTYDVAVVGEGGSAREGLAIVGELIKTQPSLGCIVAAEEPGLDIATAVMRAGAVDLIGPATTGRALQD